MAEKRTFYEAMGIPRTGSNIEYAPSDPSCVRCGTMDQGNGFLWCRGEGWACLACQVASDWHADDSDGRLEKYLKECESSKENP